MKMNKNSVAVPLHLCLNLFYLKPFPLLTHRSDTCSLLCPAALWLSSLPQKTEPNPEVS